jgi:hypothetical protein
MHDRPGFNDHISLKIIRIRLVILFKQDFQPYDGNNGFASYGSG